MTAARCPHCGEPIEITVGRRAHESANANPELAARVLAYVVENGPARVRAIRRDVYGGSTSIDAALRKLEAAGEVVRTSDGIAACQARRARGEEAQG